jgi:hypothetical protein
LRHDPVGHTALLDRAVVVKAFVLGGITAAENQFEPIGEQILALAERGIGVGDLVVAIELAEREPIARPGEKLVKSTAVEFCRDRVERGPGQSLSERHADFGGDAA